MLFLVYLPSMDILNNRCLASILTFDKASLAPYTKYSKQFLFQSKTVTFQSLLLSACFENEKLAQSGVSGHHLSRKRISLLPVRNLAGGKQQTDAESAPDLPCHAGIQKDTADTGMCHLHQLTACVSSHKPSPQLLQLSLEFLITLSTASH